MALLPEVATWEPGIYQLEETDVVQGGANGIDNLQAKQIANRLLYLKGQVDAQAAGKQAADPTLTALAALVTAADKIIYATGPDAFATTTLSAFIRTLLDDTDATAARATLGAVTQADIDAAITALMSAPPATLDTLNELAAALGDDPNFATTITNLIAQKASIASLVAYAQLAVANVFTKGQRVEPVSLPVMTGVCNIDFSLSNHFYGQVTGNLTFGNAFTNGGAGKSGMIRVQQDAATLRNWAFGSYWKYVGGATAIPGQTQALGAYDEIIYHIHSVNEISFHVRSDVK